MKIGFIGSGNMASAIVSGMLTTDFAKQDIYLSDTNQQLLLQKQDEFGVNIVNTAELVAICDIVFLAVKPQIIPQVCKSLQISNTTIIISIAAGITTNKLQTLLNTKNIIRTMPNTPATLGFGATGIFSLIGENAIVDKIFRSIGISCWVENEEQIDAITALSGSGPAYFYLMFEAMIKAGITMGLSPEISKKFCIQTAIGSAKMAALNNPKILREQVTSKGGTTQVALEIFTENNFSKIIQTAMFAAKNRANELSKNL